MHTGFYHPSLALCRIFRSVCGVYRCVHAFPVNKTARSVYGMCVCVCVHAVPAKKIARSVCGMCVCFPSEHDSQISVVASLCVCLCFLSKYARPNSHLIWISSEVLASSGPAVLMHVP